MKRYLRKMVRLTINKYFNRALIRQLETLTKLKQRAYSYPLIAMILSSCGSNVSSTTDTSNVSIATVIELEGLTGVTAVADAAAANTVLIA